MFERHGFIVDLWEHNAGSKHVLQFTFLSTSLEEQAESFASLATDEDWLKERDKWFMNHLSLSFNQSSSVASDAKDSACSSSEVDRKVN